MKDRFANIKFREAVAVFAAFFSYSSWAASPQLVVTADRGLVEIQFEDRANAHALTYEVPEGCSGSPQIQTSANQVNLRMPEPRLRCSAGPVYHLRVKKSLSTLIKLGQGKVVVLDSDKGVKNWIKVDALVKLGGVVSEVPQIRVFNTDDQRKARARYDSVRAETGPLFQVRVGSGTVVFKGAGRSK